MKKNKLTIMIIAVFVVLTAVLSIVHLTTRQQEEDGAIQVVYDGKTTLVSIGDLKPIAAVNGTVTNNAGEEKQINGQGIMVSELLKLADAEADNSVVVTAADEYSVELTAEEIAAEGRAWLLIEDGTLRLIVFGDEGARRNVKNVVRLTVE